MRLLLVPLCALAALAATSRDEEPSPPDFVILIAPLGGEESNCKCFIDLGTMDVSNLVSDPTGLSIVGFSGVTGKNGECTEDGGPQGCSANPPNEETPCIASYTVKLKITDTDACDGEATHVEGNYTTPSGSAPFADPEVPEEPPAISESILVRNTKLCRMSASDEFKTEISGSCGLGTVSITNTNDHKCLGCKIHEVH